eukprot:1159403-Pelagomonas_calceolata.AAC.5
MSSLCPCHPLFPHGPFTPCCPDLAAAAADDDDAPDRLLAVYVVCADRLLAVYAGLAAEQHANCRLDLWSMGTQGPLFAE